MGAASVAVIPGEEHSISEEQRVVLITGAGRGIGAATARELAGGGEDIPKR